MDLRAHRRTLLKTPKFECQLDLPTLDWRKLYQLKTWKQSYYEAWRNLLYAWISCWNSWAASGFAGLAGFGSVRRDCIISRVTIEIFCIWHQNTCNLTCIHILWLKTNLNRCENRTNIVTGWPCVLNYVHAESSVMINCRSQKLITRLSGEHTR